MSEDLRQYGIDAPWITLTRRGHLFDLSCDICKSLESVSAYGGPEGIMGLKAVRFHLLCGQVGKFSPSVAEPLRTYSLPVREKPKPEVAKPNTSRRIELE